ncbi:MAG: hypothetical protein ACK45U_01550 [bacterium]|jgi:hypothetical protein
MKKNIFRTLFVSILLASATFFAACDEEAGIVIGVPQTFESVFAVDPFTGTSFSKIDTVSFNLDSVLDANNTERDNIQSVELTGISLAITDSTGAVISTQNFSNFKSLGANIGELTGTFSSINSIDSAAMSLINTTNPIVFPNRTETLDLLPFISKPSFRIQMSGAINNPVTTKFYLKSTITVKVNASI